jgi:hypothetical protein
MAQINSYAVSSLKLNDKILASDADTGVTKNITPAEIIANNPFQYQIGQYLQSQGGVIFHRWLSTSSLATPTTGTIQNYLVVDTNDLSASTDYATLGVDIPGVESTWDGKINTDNLILAGAPSGITVGTAAELCSSSTNNGKNDWYLPAIDELYKIFQNRWEVAQGISASGGTQTALAPYWSSTEYNSGAAMVLDLLTGVTFSTSKFSMSSVRAVRRFSII